MFFYGWRAYCYKRLNPPDNAANSFETALLLQDNSIMLLKRPNEFYQGERQSLQAVG